MENSKGKEFDGFQIILKLEICAEKIVFNCSTLKKNRLLFVTFKKQRRRERDNYRAIFASEFCARCEFFSLYSLVSVISDSL